MRNYGVTDEAFERIFGPKEEAGPPGRSRRCRSCGGWHRLDKPWPHNCREDSPRMQHLAAPQLAPRFDPFRTGVLDTAEVIGSRNEKREYMKRNNLVEYEEGVGRRVEWVEDYEHRRDIVADLKRFHETDPLNLSPDLKAQRMDDKEALDGAPEIKTDDIEIIK